MNLSQQMATRLLLLLACGLSAIGAAGPNRPPAQSTVPLNRAEAQAVMVIQAYTDGLAGVRAASPDVHLSVGRDASIPDEPVLMVEYPAPSNNPASRDVQCAAEHQDWSAGQAIQSTRSCREALGVVLGSESRRLYDLDGIEGRRVAIGSHSVRRDAPDPYFQPSTP